MLLGGVDVVVSDGFSGNIVLKTAEGVAKWLFTELKEVFMMSTKNKLAAAVIKGDVKGIARRSTPMRSAEPRSSVFQSPSSRLTAHPATRHSSPLSARPRPLPEADIVSDIENNIDYMKISEEA